jgi:phospholipase C
VADLIGRPPGFYTDSAVGVVPFEQSVMYQLEKAGVSWGYYVYGYRGGVPYPLTAFSGAERYIGHYGDYGDFLARLGNCSIPAVSWVMFFGGSSDEYDMHPPHNATAGALAVLRLVEAVERSPCWNSTAVFITFDEGGGFYDQVAPPAVDPFGLGQRVPLIIVSPYAKEGYVDNHTMSDYTILAFIDYNWGLPYLTPEVADSDLQGLLDAFNFSAPPRPPLEPSNWTYPLPLQYPVHYGYIAAVPEYATYADVYRAPGLDALPWLTVALLALLAAWAVSRRRPLAYAAAAISAVEAPLSAYIYYAWPMYQFVAQYYVAVSGLALGGFALWTLGRIARRPRRG